MIGIERCNNFSDCISQFIEGLMYVSLRNKNNILSINTSEILNSSGDQPRLDSASSKRFSRKQTQNFESTRTGKVIKLSDSRFKPNHEERGSSTQSRQQKKIGVDLSKTDEMFLKISCTPIKNKQYPALISTDRATASSGFPLDSYQSVQLYDTPTVKKNQMSDLQSELQLKAAEIMLLEDENMRLKRDISTRESDYLKARSSLQKTLNKTITELKEKIQSQQNSVQTVKKELETVKKELLAKNQQIRNFRKTEASITRQLKGVKYQKTLLQKQIQELYKRKLPTNVRELMSFREIALQNQVEELRAEIMRAKPQKEKQMQVQIGILQQQHCQRDSKCRMLEVHSHVLNKKVVDYQEELKIKTQQFGRCLNTIKEKNEILMNQLKLTKKQNMKLQRLTLLSKQNNRKSIRNYSPESNTLSLSITSRSP